MKFCLPILCGCVALFSFAGARAQEAMVNPVLLYSTDQQQPTVQTADSVFTVQEIEILGAKRTRRSTILREVPFALDGTYSLYKLEDFVEQTKQQLMNTNLFRNVTVNIHSLPECNISVTIAVEERWYFYPEPFVRIANGTFSQWNDRGRPLNHLNYGFRLTQNNFSGRGDRFHLNIAGGYTQKIALQYQGFYLDKALKWAGAINLAHGRNRELNYATESNKVKAVKDPDGYVNEFYQGSFDLTYRPAIKTRHQFSIGYNYNRISDTVRKLNANYSPDRNIYRYPYFAYGVSYTDFDFNPYPTRGQSADFRLYKAGFNDAFNLWQLSARGMQYWGIGKRGYLSVLAAGTLKLPFKQPYIAQQFLGYGDAYLQGYENYIVDGVAGGYSRQTLGLNLLKTEIPLPGNHWFKSLRSVPLKVYGKIYTNQGYAYNPSPGLGNTLTNRLLCSTGVGLDIVAFTDWIFKIEWSFNQLGQNGLFLH